MLVKLATLSVHVLTSQLLYYDLHFLFARLPVHHGGGGHGLRGQVDAGRREGMDLQRGGLLQPLPPTALPGPRARAGLMFAMSEGQGGLRAFAVRSYSIE